MFNFSNYVNLNGMYFYEQTAWRIRMAENVGTGETKENDGTETQREAAEKGGKVWWNLSNPRYSIMFWINFELHVHVLFLLLQFIIIDQLKISLALKQEHLIYTIYMKRNTTVYVVKRNNVNE